MSNMFDYKKRSLLWGVGTLCNIFGNDQSYAAYLQGSVLEDMQKDWRNVGNDLRAAMGQFNANVKNEQR